MDRLTVFLAVLSALLALGLLALILRALKEEKEKRRLLDELQALLADPDKAPSLSLSEGSFALFENEVKTLVARWLKLRRGRQEDSRQLADMLLWLSHQLKTPLASLRLFLEMAPGQYHTEQMQLIARMEHLLGSLLQLEKLKAGGFQLRFFEEDMPQLIRDAWATVSPGWPKVRLSLMGTGQMRCDRAFMEEAFVNLFKNACEHMPDGGAITAQVTTTPATLEVTLTDAGDGVPDDELPHLFDRFFVSAHRKAQGGAGMGLAIVKEIVRAHHGTVSARNTDSGLCFTLSFPLMHLELTKT